MAKKSVSQEVVDQGDKPIIFRCICGWWSTEQKYDLEFHRNNHLCARAGNYQHILGKKTFMANNLVDSFTL